MYRHHSEHCEQLEKQNRLSRVFSLLQYVNTFIRVISVLVMNTIETNRQTHFIFKNIPRRDTYMFLSFVLFFHSFNCSKCIESIAKISTNRTIQVWAHFFIFCFWAFLPNMLNRLSFNNRVHLSLAIKIFVRCICMQQAIWTHIEEGVKYKNCD